MFLPCTWCTYSQGCNSRALPTSDSQFVRLVAEWPVTLLQFGQRAFGARHVDFASCALSENALRRKQRPERFEMGGDLLPKKLRNCFRLAAQFRQFRERQRIGRSVAHQRILSSCGPETKHKVRPWRRANNGRV